MLADIARQLRDLRIEHRPLAALLPYARNPRTHSRAQIAQLARSIREFGWTNPVLVDGANGIIAGHGRVLAARELGLVEVPVIELAHLTAAQKRAYVIADNQTALLAGWDAELLALELGELKSIGFDLELTGFSPQELDTWLGAPAREGLVDDDAAPELPVEPVTRPGDLWLAGRAPVAVWRCHRPGRPRPAARRRTGGDGVHRSAVQCGLWRQPKDKLRGKSRKILNDDLGAGFGAFLAAACASLLRVSDGGVYICMSSSELHTLQHAFTGAGGHWSTFVIWTKNTFTLGRADYQRQFEPILYGWPEGAKRYWCGARDQGDVWDCAKPVQERPASDHEAGCPGRAGGQEFQPPGRSGAGRLRRRRLDLDRLRPSGPSCPAGRARSRLLRRHLPALAGLERRGRGARSRRPPLPGRGRRRTVTAGRRPKPTLVKLAEPEPPSVVMRQHVPPSSGGTLPGRGRYSARASPSQEPRTKLSTSKGSIVCPQDAQHLGTTAPHLEPVG